MNGEIRSKPPADVRRPDWLDGWFRRAMRNPAFRKAYKEPDEDPVLEIAHRLVMLRQKNGLTQAQLAKKCGTSQQAIARLECLDYRGYTLTTLQKIAKAVKMQVRVEFV